MAGKFINELSSNPPAPEDLVVFFDKSKAVTVQAPLSDVVGAGLNIATATKGQTAVVDTKVDPISLETIPFLKWEKAGIDFGSTTTKPSAGTDEIITHDPVTGTNGKTTLAELIKSVLPPVTGADAGKQLTVDVNGAAGWTADSSDLPAFTVADAGKSLLVKSDGTGPEWGSPLPDITAGLTALQTKADKSGVEWVESVNLSTNLKGGFTAGAFFPVNDTKADTTRFVDVQTYRRLVGVPEQLYFPGWTPTNDQVGAGWNDMGVALARMSAVVKSDPFAGNGSATFTAANSFPGSGAFFGSVLLPSGKVFCVPLNSTKAKIYDPATNSVADAGGTYTGSGIFAGGVLLPTGKVFCVPHNSTKAYIYDPATDSTTAAGGTFPGNGGLVGGVLLPSGKVFCAPHQLDKGYIYDPATDTAAPTGATFTVTATGGYKLSGAVLLPSGKVFCVPCDARNGMIYDPVADTATVTAATFDGGYAYNGGVLLPSGKVFLVPSSKKQGMVYDPVSDTATPAAGTLPHPSSYAGGVLLSSGKVFCIPSLSTNAAIYDPVTNTLSVISGTTYPGGVAYSGGVLMKSGKVFCTPSAATTAAIVDFYSPQIQTMPENFVLSPFYNKY